MIQNFNFLIFPIFLSLTLFLSSLSDFRVNAVRIFDIVAILLTLFFIFCAKQKLNKLRDLSRYQKAIPFFIIIFLWSLYGYLNFHHRSSLAIILLSTIFLLLFVFAENNLKNTNLIGKYLTFIILFHIFAFFAQYLGFILFHIVIDYQIPFGYISRIFPQDSAHVLRASGIFQEPNTYCVNIFSLLICYLNCNFSRGVFFLGILSMVLSGSLWGLAVAFFLILILFASTQSNFCSLRSLFSKLAPLLVILIFSSSTYFYFTKPSDQEMPNIYNRIKNIRTDPSFIERFKKSNRNNNIFDSYENGSFTLGHFVNNKDDLFVKMIGEGFSTHYFQLGLPANTFSLLLKSFGYFGIISLVLSFFYLISNLSIGKISFVSAYLVIIFTSYPILTYYIFWISLFYLIVTLTINKNNEKK